MSERKNWKSGLTDEKGVEKEKKIKAKMLIDLIKQLKCQCLVIPSFASLVNLDLKLPFFQSPPSGLKKNIETF